MDPTRSRISSGNGGLDVILRGGLPANRVYLIEGMPGTGKTTLALQFLRAAADAGEPALYITLSETKEELAVVAESHGFDTSGFDVFEFSALNSAFGAAHEQSVIHPWEMELGETIKLIRQEVERVQPRRVVFDSLSEMRLLAQDPLHYRRQVLGLKQFFVGRNSTVVLVDDMSGAGEGQDSHLHSICHGVITLERFSLDFGPARRRMQVQKLRGVDFVAGFHDFAIRKGGLEIYPRLIAAQHHQPFGMKPAPSGIPQLDALLDGGPLRGSSLLLTGPAGVGKTTIALQFIQAACDRGEPAALYEFDERIGTLQARAEAIGLQIGRHVDSGRCVIEQIDPAELSPGEFAARVKSQVEQRKARVIAIDSLNGYLAAMPQEKQLILQLHELLSYLSQQGVVSFLIDPQQGLLEATATNLNISYIADAVLLLRYFEAEGRIRKAISVIKNRGGKHEDSIREFKIDSSGVRVGEPLVDFQGVMTGTPLYKGTARGLMEERARDA
jgi:circadian clock protein KaiC